MATPRSWFSHGLDEARRWSKTSPRPVVGVSDGVIGYFRLLDEGESVDDAVADWRAGALDGPYTLRVYVYEGGEQTDYFLSIPPQEARKG